MTTWKKSLSPAVLYTDPSTTAIQYLAIALTTENAESRANHLRWAGAAIRQWRGQLPERSHRYPDRPQHIPDRELIRGALVLTTTSDPTAHLLRIAEANLRTLWRRHTAANANAQEGTADASKPKPAVGDQADTTTAGTTADGSAPHRCRHWDCHPNTCKHQPEP